MGTTSKISATSKPKGAASAPKGAAASAAKATTASEPKGAAAPEPTGAAATTPDSAAAATPGDGAASDNRTHLAALREMQAIGGSPPLLPGEERAAYERLWLGVAAAFDPRDFLDYLDVQHDVDLRWDELRRRACAPGMLKAAIPQAIRQLLETAMDYRDANEISKAYADGDDDDRKEVEAQLAAMGYTDADIRGVAFAIRLREIETLERLGAKGDWRRRAIRLDLDRRRDRVVRQPPAPAAAAGAGDPTADDTGDA